MAHDQNQYDKECDIARMLLRNTIRNNKNPTMVANAKEILKNPKLFERFVANRISKKQAAKEQPAKSSFSLSSLMFWKR